MSFYVVFGLLYYRIVRALWAEGGSIGFLNQYVKIPEKNLTVIILTNLNGNWGIVKDSNLLVQAALKLPDKKS